MTHNEIALIRSLQGDARTVSSKFDYILFESLSNKMNDDRTLFELRQIVHKCDYISTMIEQNFNKNAPFNGETEGPAEGLPSLSKVENDSPL